MAEATTMRLKSMANMSQGIVIGLVVCNVPLIVWTQIYLVKLMQCKKEEFISSAFGVHNVTKYHSITIINNTIMCNFVDIQTSILLLGCIYGSCSDFCTDELVRESAHLCSHNSAF